MRPCRHLHRLPFSESLEAELQKPFGFAFLRRNQPDDVLIQSCRHNIRLHVGREAVFVLLRSYVLDYTIHKNKAAIVWRLGGR